MHQRVQGEHPTVQNISDGAGVLAHSLSLTGQQVTPLVLDLAQRADVLEHLRPAGAFTTGPRPK